MRFIAELGLHPDYLTFFRAAEGQSRQYINQFLIEMGVPEQNLAENIRFTRTPSRYGDVYLRIDIIIPEGNDQILIDNEKIIREINYYLVNNSFDIKNYLLDNLEEEENLTLFRRLNPPRELMNDDKDTNADIINKIYETALINSNGIINQAHSQIIGLLLQDDNFRARQLREINRVFGI